MLDFTELQAEQVGAVVAGTAGVEGMLYDFPDGTVGRIHRAQAHPRELFGSIPAADEPSREFLVTVLGPERSLVASAWADAVDLSEVWSALIEQATWRTNG